MIATLLLCTAFVTAVPTADTGSPAPTNVAGIVNGDTIALDAYAREVGRRSELNSLGGTLDGAEVMEQTWKAMVHDVLIQQEANRRLIAVTKEHVDSVLLKATPDFVRRGIVDERGRFDKSLLEAMLYRPDSLAKAHMPSASPTTLKKNVASIRKTVGELRSRLANQIREQRLREAVENLAPLDSAALRKLYDESLYYGTADVAFLPCEPQRIVPTDADIEAWYKADPLRYKTDVPMRQLGVFVWPMTAAPFDSSVVLQNVRAFIAMINGEHNSVRRDSIWNSIAESVHHTTVRLYPDSSSQRFFYDAVNSTRNGKPGTCVGPLIHPDGVHVILVDSTTGGKKPEYVVRVLMSTIEPGEQTADSILHEVRSAANDYRNGSTVEEIAKKYRRKFTLTKWVNATDKLLGSYRLVQAAFQQSVGNITDPVDTPEEGIVLAVVVDSIQPGIMPAEAARDNIIADINRDYACLRVTRKAESLRAVTTRLGDGRMFVAETIKGSSIWRDITVDGSGYVGPEVYDPTASLAIRRGTPGTILGPFRGDAGWWVANITSANKHENSNYESWLVGDGALHVQKQRDDAWVQWLTRVERDAAIVDFRWLYFRF